MSSPRPGRSRRIVQGVNGTRLTPSDKPYSSDSSGNRNGTLNCQNVKTGATNHSKSSKTSRDRQSISRSRTSGPRLPSRERGIGKSLQFFSTRMSALYGLWLSASAPSLANIIILQA